VLDAVVLGKGVGGRVEERLAAGCSGAAALPGGYTERGDSWNRLMHASCRPPPAAPAHPTSPSPPKGIRPSLDLLVDRCLALGREVDARERLLRLLGLVHRRELALDLRGRGGVAGGWGGVAARGQQRACSGSARRGAAPGRAVAAPRRAAASCCCRCARGGAGRAALGAAAGRVHSWRRRRAAAASPATAGPHAAATRRPRPRARPRAARQGPTHLRALPRPLRRAGAPHRGERLEDHARQLVHGAGGAHAVSPAVRQRLMSA
jgi:hypothetical protein